ncbi:hypothetical protein [uncultured Sunxiuqinia sp.]|uniref:hypothetical protein n=1 Tax=Sunxiuqinia rutila TaxID=1397841 RepID=UPI002621693B|nr:hypothetical protein [uncultured Sunxiuqinia sp.]
MVIKIQKTFINGGVSLVEFESEIRNTDYGVEWGKPYSITISVILYFNKRLAFESLTVDFSYGQYGEPKFIFYSPFFMGFVWRLFR